MITQISDTIKHVASVIHHDPVAKSAAVGTRVSLSLLFSRAAMENGDILSGIAALLNLFRRLGSAPALPYPPAE